MRLLPKDQEWTAYAYLVYLAFYLIPGVAFMPGLEAKAIVIVVTLAGAVLYFAGYWLCGYQVFWVVAAFLVLGMVGASSNPGASVFFIYAASFIGKAVEAPKVYAYLGGLLVLIGVQSWIMRFPPWFWVPAVVFSALIGSLVNHEVQRKRLNTRLLRAQEEVARLATTAERERIGRDLHDLLGHTLSLIVLKSELASRLAAKDPERAVKEIRDVERISREALAQVRAAVRGYRSAGLQAELREALRALEAAGIQVETAMVPARIPAAQEGVVGLALREAVTNVVRHAQATSCRVTLRQDGKWCELEVRDNGLGGEHPEGTGLSGMRQRVEALGGALERDGSAGTCLRIKVPV
jgi:two-component system sensor histidine kinase DesK